MIPSKEYLEQISKKLDTFNKINGVNPEMKKETFNGAFDPFDHTGKAALSYIEKRKSEEINHTIDPLFTDHNKY